MSSHILLQWDELNEKGNMAREKQRRNPRQGLRIQRLVDDSESKLQSREKIKPICSQQGGPLEPLILRASQSSGIMYISHFHCSSPCLFLKAIKTTKGLVDQRVSILKGRENRLDFASSLVHRSKIPRTTGHQRNAMCFNTFAS